MTTMEQVVVGTSSFEQINVNSNPPRLTYFRICPEERLPVEGKDLLHGYYYDIGFFNASKDREEILTCQRIESSLVTMYQKIRRIYRLQGALNLGSSGSPTINNYGEVVTLHLTSFHSAAKRKPQTRFRMQNNRVQRFKRPNDVEDQFVVLFEEQENVRETLDSIVNSFNVCYKEGFTLCKSSRLKELLATI